MKFRVLLSIIGLPVMVACGLYQQSGHLSDESPSSPDAAEKKDHFEIGEVIKEQDKPVLFRVHEHNHVGYFELSGPLTEELEDGKTYKIKLNVTFTEPNLPLSKAEILEHHLVERIVGKFQKTGPTFDRFLSSSGKKFSLSGYDFPKINDTQNYLVQLIDEEDKLDIGEWKNLVTVVSIKPIPTYTCTTGKDLLLHFYEDQGNDNMSAVLEGLAFERLYIAGGLCKVSNSTKLHECEIKRAHDVYAKFTLPNLTGGTFDLAVTPELGEKAKTEFNCKKVDLEKILNSRPL